MFSSIFRSRHHLVELARTAKRLPPVWLAALMAIVFVFLGQLFGAIPYAILLGFGLLPSAATPLGGAVYLLIFFTLTLLPTGLLLLLWVAVVERRPVRTLGLEGPAWLKKLLRGFAGGLLLFSLIVLISAIFGWIDIQPQNSPLPLLVFASLLTLPGWLLQSSLEELVMRGWLLPVIGARRSVALGLLISSLLFAILHLFNPEVSLLSTLNIALAGLMFALLVLWEGSIWGAFGLHSAWNWIQGSVYGFPVSGNIFQSPSIWKMVENGPDWLTGGKFGPEGGLIATLVLVGACLLLGWMIYRRQKRQPQPVAETDQ